jgi:hypothetical protein
MKIKCVVAAINTNGKPDFFFCMFDEHDGPAWLFEHFAWDSATVVSASAS